MKIVDDAGKDAPEDEIGAFEGDCLNETDPLPSPPEDRDGGDAEEHRLDDEQDSSIVPEPVQGRDDHQDRMKVVAEQVADHRHRIRDHLQPAVAPDGLVLDAEVEGVAAEM